MTPTNRDELVALMVEASLGGSLAAGKPGEFVHDLEAKCMVDVIDAMIKAGLAVVPAQVTEAMERAWFNADLTSSDEWYAMLAAGRIDGGTT